MKETVRIPCQKSKSKMYPKEITLRYLTGQEMQNCGGPSGRIYICIEWGPIKRQKACF